MAAQVTVSAVQAAAIEAAKPVAAFAVDLAKADVAYEQVLPTIATNVARVLGDEKTVTFEKWEAVQECFIAAYVKQRNCVQETGRNRWVAVAGWLKNNMALEKPAKKSDAGTKKAKERAAMDKKIKAAKAQFVKPADAIQKAQELIAEGKVAEAKVVQAAAAELFKQVADDAKKQNGDKLKKMREDARAAIAKCEDVALLQAALEVLRNGKEEATKPEPKLKRVVKRQEKASA